MATFPGWHEEVDENGSERDVKPFPSRSTSYLVAFFQTAASLLALVSVVWQQSAAGAYVSAVDRFKLTAVVTHVGAAGSALAWVACSLEILVAISTVCMIASIKLLDGWLEGDDERPAVKDNDEG